MPALSNHLRLPLTRRFQSAIGAVVDRTTPVVQRAWDGLDGYDTADIATLTDRTAAALRAAKQASFTASSGYYSAISGVPAPRMTVGQVASEAALRDPFIATWRALKQGRDYLDAVAAGRARMDAVVANFANSTARQTGDLFIQSAGLRSDGWERITEPGACDWCVLVAGQTYKTADSADFGHDRCGCTAVPKL